MHIGKKEVLVPVVDATLNSHKYAFHTAQIAFHTVSLVQGNFRPIIALTIVHKQKIIIMNDKRFLKRTTVGETTEIQVQVPKKEKESIDNKLKAAGIASSALLFGGLLLSLTGFKSKAEIDSGEYSEDPDGASLETLLAGNDEDTLAMNEESYELAEGGDDSINSIDLELPDPDMENLVIHTSAPFAQNTLDHDNFADAFAAAREELGAGGFFDYNGQIYNTYYKEEWDALGLDGQEQFMASLDYNVPGYEGYTAEGFDGADTYVGASSQDGIRVEGTGMDVEVTASNPVQEGGEPYIYGADHNNDGVVDVTYIDGNADGHFDVSIINNNQPDYDGDKDVDIVAVDVNSDKVIEITHVDGNSDGMLDVSVINNSITDTPEPVAVEEEEIEDFDIEDDFIADDTSEDIADLDMPDLG